MTEPSSTATVRERPNRVGMWSFGREKDEDGWPGEYLDTAEQAAHAAVGYYDDENIDELVVGQLRRPADIDELVSVENWYELFDGHDDWFWDFCDIEPLANALDDRTASGQELRDNVRRVVAEWLDKHGLRAKHYCIDEATVMKVTDVLRGAT